MKNFVKLFVKALDSKLTTFTALGLLPCYVVIAVWIHEGFMATIPILGLWVAMIALNILLVKVLPKTITIRIPIIRIRRK